MPLVATKLASELDSNMELVDNEQDGINNFCSAFETYFCDASVTGIPCAAGTLASATNTMKSSMVGISQSGQGSIKIQAGIIAFWGVVASSATTIWATVPPNIGATPPPLLNTIAAALEPVFVVNINGGFDKTTCLLNIANVIHPLMLGGIAHVTNVPPPPPTVPQPIL